MSRSEIDTETLRIAVRAIDEAEKEARDFREHIVEVWRRRAETSSDLFVEATMEQLVETVEASRALDALVETRKAELDALVNGKPKRKRAKKAKTEEKAEPKIRKALGRKGLPKGEVVT